MTWATTLAWVLKHWKLIVWLASTGALLLALTVSKGETRHFQKLYTAEKTANDMLAQTYRAASEKARADAEAEARATEQHYAQVQKEQSDALRTQLADARALARRYASLHPAPGADQGQPGKADLPGSSSASGGIAPASGFAIVPVADLDTCATAVVGFRGWQDWWARVSGK